MDDLSPLWALVPVEPGVPLAKVGGAPEPAGALRWPVCAACGAPMRFLFQLPHVAGRLDLAPYAALYVFQCENPDTVCFRWDAFAGANAVVAVEPGPASMAGAPASPHPLPESRLDFARAREDTEALSVDVNAATDEQLAALDRASAQAPENKVGGVPVWVNGEARPECCGEPMHFVAQLSALPFGLGFGDAGRGYVFRCRAGACGTAFRFLWQGA
ncbi:hypothetical protein [Melittangium boletus]|uniref:DUF1963 domain-containing protein n=1 Tax=Melittangium boletus DSM 14713 TaxID=1294270 RepID=A0A250IJ02_9BACT|nr:hypothetical protein [Melittangium boletus]ATB31161.1 hypothetical protein MEBOL_004623 [Melittangium boletus DSM 14713]